MELLNVKVHIQLTSNPNHILTMGKLNVILSIAFIENIITLQT